MGDVALVQEHIVGSKGKPMYRPDNTVSQKENQCTAQTTQCHKG